MTRNVKKLEELRLVVLQEIIADRELSAFGKLKRIDELRLLPYAKFVQNEFEEWEDKFRQSLMEKYNATNHFIIDSIFNPHALDFEKYESVSYYKALDGLRDKMSHEGALIDEIAILTLRGHQDKIIKSFDEIVAQVLNFCVEKQIIGFKNDW